MLSKVEDIILTEISPIRRKLEFFLVPYAMPC